MNGESTKISRIDLRSVFVGVITISALMLLSMSLIAAMGHWNFRLRELSQLKMPFWYLSCIAWSVSLFGGCFIAASGAKSTTTSEGIYNALAASSGAIILLAVALLFFTPEALMALIGKADQLLYFKIFTVAATGIGFGIIAGIAGAHFENNSNQKAGENLQFKIEQ